MTNALAVFASARGRNVAGESMKTEGTARGKRERERGRQTHRKREERERELSDYLMEQHSDMKGGREKKNREKRRKRKIERIGGGKEKRRRGGKSEKRREKKYKREKRERGRERKRERERERKKSRSQPQPNSPALATSWIVASHGKIECILTYTFLSLPVLYSDSSSTGPPAALNGPPGCLPIAPGSPWIWWGNGTKRSRDGRKGAEGVK